MAEKKKKSEKTDGESTEETKHLRFKRYEKLIDRLKKEREDLQRELNDEYRDARRYVRSHPEEGVLIGFVGGVALGYLLGKLSK